MYMYVQPTYIIIEAREDSIFLSLGLNVTNIIAVAL